MKENKQPWSGRFNEPMDQLVADFTSSIHFDWRLYRHDIQGSIAHARMLAKQGLINKDEEEKIVKGLKEIRRDIDNGKVEFRKDLEDIHMNIETLLKERIGEAAYKLHTARSRNDQVALDMRLYLRDETDEIIRLLKELRKKIVNSAREHIDFILPGYTHMQRAQPVSLGHHLMAYYEMFTRDYNRFRSVRDSINVLPLGSGALAGTSLPIDMEFVADALGFEKIINNSMDAVSDRDFIIEFIFASSLFMMHASRLAEELVLWSSSEFGFVEISDSFCTGSSLMPQKKNPDVMELTRGKTGRVYGHLISLLTITKGLPLTYNRDLQEDKEPLFDTVDTIKATIEIISAVMEHMRFQKDRMIEATRGGYLLATDLADYLVLKGVPFRQAHHEVGNLVNYAIKAGKELYELTISEMKKFLSKVEEDVYKYLDVERAVDKRISIGGTSREMVRRAISKAEEELK